MAVREGDAPAGTALPDAELHAEGFRKTREAQRFALAEDYVELIADLIESGQEARQVDIAARLGVAQPTVARMLDRLAADGLVYRKPYRAVFLTDAGRRIAEESRERHQTVVAFLRSLGVSADTALRIGLVSEVVPAEQLWPRAHEIAAAIAAKPPSATQGTVKAIWESLDKPYRTAMEQGLIYTRLGNPLGKTELANQSEGAPRQPKIR